MILNYARDGISCYGIARSKVNQFRSRPSVFASDPLRTQTTLMHIKSLETKFGLSICEELYILRDERNVQTEMLEQVVFARTVVKLTNWGRLRRAMYNVFGITN